MAIAVSRSGPRTSQLRGLLSSRPELTAVPVIALAWAVLLIVAAQGTRTGGGSQSAGMSPGMSGMPGMGEAGSGGLGRALSDMASQLPQWLVMSVAMMGPLALAGVRHTGLNSFGWRRHRAMAEFGAGYLAVWCLFGGVALTAAALVAGGPDLARLSVVLVAAVAWQLSPFKYRFLRECHRSLPLPLRGWRAERGALEFGFRNGLSCLGSCWCMMLVMVVAPAGHVVWTVALGCLATVEGLTLRPRRITRLVAAGLAAAALGSVLVALG
jgi:predicted metal-binding membrane protein